jgi:hypothetical protein
MPTRPARLVIVHHPYYEQFAACARQVLSRHDQYGAFRYGSGSRRVLELGLQVRQRLWHQTQIASKFGIRRRKMF